jgi:hypothetical protein
LQKSVCGEFYPVFYSEFSFGALLHRLPKR